MFVYEYMKTLMFFNKEHIKRIDPGDLAKGRHMRICVCMYVCMYV
jgi:hypothetical protein